MSKFIVEVIDTDIYINGTLQFFSTEMDEENREDDLKKKAILALACEMGYEPGPLFEEMAYRLDEMLDEI